MPWGPRTRTCPRTSCSAIRPVTTRRGTLTWSSGWLPALYRGTEFSSAGSPVLNLKPAHDQPAGVQEANLDFLGRMNRLHQRQYPGESVLETRIQNYELAARMQLAAGRVLDLSNETAATRQALRARRSASRSRTACGA